MTQPQQQLVIPQGLNAKRSMHWSLKLLLIGITVSVVGTTGYMTAIAMSVGNKIDERFPAAYRKEAQERMSRVSPLLKETVFYTECPVVPSVLDPLQKRAKVISAQFGAHRGIANPYVEHETLKEREDLWTIFVENLVSHFLVEYKFTSDEQLDLFLDGVRFDIDEDTWVEGVVAASGKLLGKPPVKLTPLEVALLASRIYYPRPYIVRPDPQLTQERVLLKMKEKELISKKELEVALKDPSVSRERYPASEDE